MNQTHAQIKATMPDDLEQQVFKVLVEHQAFGRTNAMRREHLVNLVFGVRPLSSLSNSKEDRQIRRAIANLQSEGIPIVSDSYSGGYYLGTTAEIRDYIGELRSRIQKLIKKADALETKLRVSGDSFQSPLI